MKTALHPQIAELTKQNIEMMRIVLNELRQENTEELFTKSVNELRKIRHDENDSKGYKYFMEASEAIYELTKLEDIDWIEAIGSLGSLLDKENWKLHNIAKEEYTTEQDINTFYDNEAEAVYYTLGEIIE